MEEFNRAPVRIENLWLDDSMPKEYEHQELCLFVFSMTKLLAVETARGTSNPVVVLDASG